MDQFLLQPNEYVRDLNVLQNYIDDGAFYLHRRTGLPLEKCIESVKMTIGRDGTHPVKNPVVTMVDKDENGDRLARKTGYIQYLKNIVSNNLICAPSMTTYLQPSVKQSEMGVYINGNLDLRNKAKKEMFAADQAAQNPKLSEEERAKFAVLASMKNNEQTSHKIFNNGISGMQAIGSTPMYLRSAHSSLTSGCRTATSYGNAAIERFVAGSRHYWSMECVKTNIVSVLRHTDYELVQRVMEKYGIRPPTVEEVLAGILRATELYVQNDVEFAEVRLLVETLSDIERAAYLYTGDFYHLRVCNPDVAREIIARLGKVVGGTHPDPIAGVKKLKGDHKALVTILCAEVTKGTTIDDLVNDNNLEALSMLVNTFDNVMTTLDDYRDLIRAFWITRNVPPNISKTRDIKRRSVVGSDTDSCLFSVADWVQWFTGRCSFDKECDTVWHVTVFLACQVVTHTLNCLSAGMGVMGKNVLKLAMKNEFAFPVFVLTPRAKHYYAAMAAREGNVFTKLKYETKGVGFHDSNLAKSMVEKGSDYIKQIIDGIYENGGFHMGNILKDMADTERSVVESIKRGEVKFLKAAYVKTKESYKKPMVSNYFSAEVWMRAFGPQYGNPAGIPYRGVRVSLQLDNKTALREWLDSIGDVAMRRELEELYGSKGKVASIILPQEVVEIKGIPEEILRATNLRRLVYGTLANFYLVQESVGINLTNKKLTRLISDML